MPIVRWDLKEANAPELGLDEQKPDRGPAHLGRASDHRLRRVDHLGMSRAPHRQVADDVRVEVRHAIGRMHLGDGREPVGHLAILPLGACQSARQLGRLLGSPHRGVGIHRVDVPFHVAVHARGDVRRR